MRETVTNSTNTPKRRKPMFSKKLFTERPHLPDTDNFGMNKEPYRFNSISSTTDKSWRSSGDDL